MSGSYVRADVQIRELYADLLAAGEGVEKELTHELSDAAHKIADDAKPHMRLGTEDWAVRPGQVQLPHIRDTYTVTARGLVANVVSSHPAAPVWEFGGQIHPRQTITIPREAPVHQAALEDLDLIERNLRSAVDRLLDAFRL